MAGRPPQYDWKQILREAAQGGKVLIAGTHFDEHVLVNSMRNQLYQAGKRLGYRVSVEVREDVTPTMLRVSAVPTGDLAPYFSGVQQMVNPVDVGMKPYEFERALKAESVRRGVEIRTVIDDAGIVHFKSAMPK